MVKLSVKLLIACGLIYWLFKSGRLELSLLYRSFDNVQSWALCLSILIGNIFLIAFRWKKILELKSGQNFSFLTILRLTWIGNLFNTVLPGAVSGDIIKLVYAHQIDRTLSKTYLVTSVILDRIIGLAGLLFLLGIFSLLNYPHLVARSPHMAHLIHFNFIITLGMILAILFIFFSSRYQKGIIALIAKIPYLSTTAHKTLPQMLSFGAHRKSLLSLIILSMITQALNILSFWFITSPFLEYALPGTRPLSLSKAFTFIPLGFVTMAIPITPAGLGIGHAAFSSLYGYFGVVNGASLFNLHFLAVVTINLLGIFPYLIRGSKHSQKDLAEFETMA